MTESTLLLIYQAGMIYFSLQVTLYLLQTCAALHDSSAQEVRTELLQASRTDEQPGLLLPISVLVPAFNEELTVADSVLSLLGSHYPQLEAIVINDGSADRTLEHLRERFDLVPVTRTPQVRIQTAPVRGVYRSRSHPQLIVIDKENGGKADALNAGLNMARYPLVAAIDADTLLERESLLRAMRPFLEDPRTVGTSGIVRILNGCRAHNGAITQARLPQRALPLLQALDYAHTFFISRVAFGWANALPLISGSFGIFRKEAVVAVGGWDRRTVGEDMLLVIALHAYYRKQGAPYRMATAADAVAWTEAPETVSQLIRQRARWYRGLFQVLWRFRGMCGNPRYGRLGLWILPYQWIFELWEPVVRLVMVAALTLGLGLGLVSPRGLMVGLFLLSGVHMLVTLCALYMQECRFGRHEALVDLARVYLMAAVDVLWYRWLLWWARLYGLWQLVRGRRGWGEMRRTAAWKEAA